MSFFAYFAFTNDIALYDRISGVLVDMGYTFKKVDLSSEFGLIDLYGEHVAGREICEIELVGHSSNHGRLIDIESALLEPEKDGARFDHYMECADKLGISVKEFHDSEAVDHYYRDNPIDLGAVTLVHRFSEIEGLDLIVFNLDPDFEIRFGDYIELYGIEAIRKGLWENTVFSDLEEPVRLVWVRA